MMCCLLLCCSDVMGCDVTVVGCDVLCCVVI